MTRSSDLVMVERAVLERARNRIHTLGVVHSDYRHFEANEKIYLPELDAALQSVEGGVQGAAKQESCPESAPRTETAVREILLRLRATATEQLGNTYALLSSPPKSDAAWQIRNAIDKELARIDAVSSGATNSAPGFKASHNSGERDPVVMPDCPGADTKSDGGVEVTDTQKPEIGSVEFRGKKSLEALPGSCASTADATALRSSAGVVPGPSDTQLPKTPSADHDAGNLRSLAEPTPRDSSESTTGGAK